MTTQHTPTPWTQHGLEVRGGAMIVARTTAKGWSEKDLPEREANAAFIVRACNAHEELLTLVKELRYSTPPSKRKAIDAAIAKAEGK